jgi:hypothetical protein
MEKLIKVPTKPTLKRKVGYADEGVSTTRAKLAQLKIGAEERGAEEAADAGPSTKSG